MTTKIKKFKKWIIALIFGTVVLAAPLVFIPVPDVALEKIQQKYEASELKDKYRLEKTAFILDAIDENAIQAEVGNKNLDKFTPELTLRKWSDEVNFKVKYKHGEKEKDQKVDIENKKIKWKGKKTEVHYYDIKKGELLHDKVLESDVYEVEVLLLEKSDTNVVEFDIETKGLKFYYQPELTQKEKDEGAFRPENVIGSYAVYHESKQGDYSKMGKKNYRAGKAFHIYRPKIIDNAGTEVWGKLNITDNLLTVEIPQEFLDNAVYPVIVDPTFGCNPAVPGESAQLVWDNDIYGIADSPAQSGNATKITAYITDWGAYDPALLIRGLLYDDSNDSFITNGETNEINAPTSYNWADLTFGTPPSLDSAKTYVISIWCNSNDGADYIGLRYDSSGASRYHDEAGTFPTYPNPANFVNQDKIYAIYCTYTADGAERRIINIQ